MTSEGTVYDQYFEWLYGKVASIRNRNPSRSYWNLCRALYTTRFEWFVPNDDNRVGDGLQLRQEFVDQRGYQDFDRMWWDLDCSIFEMLIALSRRVSFQSRGTPAEWFWNLVENLGLRQYTDDIYEISIAEEVEETLRRFNERRYGSDGRGGLFPLKYPQQDQREIELWYQMSMYLEELHEF